MAQKVFLPIPYTYFYCNYYDLRVKFPSYNNFNKSFYLIFIVISEDFGCQYMQSKSGANTVVKIILLHKKNILPIPYTYFHCN
jgi:hypothetical protein